jgi:hypothetical protein
MPDDSGVENKIPSGSRQKFKIGHWRFHNLAQSRPLKRTTPPRRNMIALAALALIRTAQSPGGNLSAQAAPRFIGPGTIFDQDDDSGLRNGADINLYRGTLTSPNVSRV